MRVYLAGPINGCTDDEASTWRDKVKAAIGEDACLDPMRRDYRGREDDAYREIVEGDLEDIDLATVVVANAWTPSVGTAMECWYAHNEGVPIVVVAPPDGRLSPWWRYIAADVVDNLDAAIEAATKRS